jgi:hypothetical protein
MNAVGACFRQQRPSFQKVLADSGAHALTLRLRVHLTGAATRICAAPAASEPGAVARARFPPAPR